MVKVFSKSDVSTILESEGISRNNYPGEVRYSVSASQLQIIFTKLYHQAQEDLTKSQKPL
jgi:anthranilate phosphoribosyltransferase